MEKPKMIENPDLSELIDICQKHLDSLEDGSYNDDGDDKFDIYDVTMRMLYGDNVTKYIDERQDFIYNSE